MAGMSMDHGCGVSDWIDIEGSTQGTVTSATTATQSAALVEGVYDVWSTQDTFIKVGTTANDVTATSGYLVRSGNTLPVLVRGGSKIGAIMSASVGVLSYHKVR